MPGTMPEPDKLNLDAPNPRASNVKGCVRVVAHLLFWVVLLGTAAFMWFVMVDPSWGPF
jgi:hypothetical protein